MNRHFIPFEESPERAELHDQRRALRTAADDLRRENARLDRANDLLRQENAHLRRELDAKKRRWWLW